MSPEYVYDDYGDSGGNSGGGSVMDFLGYFDRPRNMVASAVKSLQDTGDPFEMLSGAYQGLSGQRDVSWGDVAGIPEATEEDDWATWLAKKGGSLALDVIGDPLNLAFGTGAITKGLGLAKGGVSLAGRTAKALGGDTVKEFVAGGPLGQALMHRLPNIEAQGVNYPRAQEIIDRAQYAHSPEIVNREAAATRQATEDAITGMGREVTPMERMEAIERMNHPRPQGGLADLSEESVAQWGANVPEEFRPYYDAMSPFLEKKYAGHEALRAKQLEHGVPVTGAIDTADLNYVPQMFEHDKGLIPKALPKLGETPINPNLDPEASREIFNFFNQGKLSNVGRADDARTGVRQLVDEFEGLPSSFSGGTKYTDDFGHELTRQQASAYDKQMAFPSLKGKFLDPLEATRRGRLADEAKMGYLDSIGQLKAEGMLSPITEEGVQKGFRDISNIPGCEGLQAPKGLATYLDNLATSKFDDTRSMGAIGDVLKKFNETRIGRGITGLTTWGKRNALADPGWISGNVLSNQGLLFEGGMNPLSMPARTAQAIKTQLGKGSDVIEGLPNTVLKKELINRRLGRGAWFGSQADDIPTGYGGKTRAMAEGVEDVPVIGKAARGLAYGAEKYGGFNDWMFKVGGATESNAKFAAAIDWIKKNAPDIATKSPEEQVSLFDKAANAAHSAMIDYGNLTPLEKEMKNIVPFYPWMRGITGLTAEYATKSPQRLANLGRGIDTVFQPMSQEDKKIADPWTKESAPVMGAFGSRFGVDDKGRPNMAMLARFLPQGDTERMLKRPADYLMSAINPIFKAPTEMAFNYNAFKDRPIDKIAGGFPANILNPLVGRPYELATRQTFGQALPQAYDYISSQIPGARRLNELRQLAHATGIAEDPYKEPQTPQDYGLWLATGGKTYPFDREKAQKNRRYEFQSKKSAVMGDMRYAAQRGDEGSVEYYQRLLADMMDEKYGSSEGYQVNY